MPFPQNCDIHGMTGKNEEKGSDKFVLPKLLFVLNLFLRLSYNRLPLRCFTLCV